MKAKHFYTTALSMLFFLTLGFQALAQPANDLCSNAIPITCGGSVTGTNVGATSDVIPACGSVTIQKHGVWYTIVGNGGEITLSTCGGTNFDSQIGVFTGSCGSFTCVAGNNNDYSCSFSRASTVSFTSVSGTTYYVLVTGVIGARGTFTLTASCGSPVTPGSSCAGAIDIACGDIVSGSTVGGVVQSVTTCGTAGNTAPGVWYKLAGTGTQLAVSTCNAGTNFDTKLQVWSGACGSLVCVGGNDDFSGCSFSSLRSRYVFNAAEGTDYYILVTGFSSNTGAYQLSVEGECDVTPPPPACTADGIYDNACDADCLTLGVTTNFTNVGATAQVGEPNPGAGTVGTSPSCDATDGWCSFELDIDNSVWFKFVAPASGCVDIEVLTADYQMAVWSVGDCGNFATYTEVGANDDGGPSFAPALFDLAVTPGNTYYVQIDGYDGTAAAGTVLVSDCTANRTQNLSSTLTIKDFDPNMLSVGEIFPNPVNSGVANLNINAVRDVEAQVQLFDQTGKLMQQSKHLLYGGLNTLQLDVAGYAAGIYYAVVKIDSELFQKKLVVTARP